jgi:hypothetical protein
MQMDEDRLLGVPPAVEGARVEGPRFPVGAGEAVEPRLGRSVDVVIVQSEDRKPELL